MLEEFMKVYEVYVNAAKKHRVNRIHWTANLDYYVRKRNAK